MEGIFHRIQVIEVAEELVEAVDRGQIFVAVPEMVLTELTGRVAHCLEGRSDGRRLGRHAYLGARLTHRSESRADWQLSGREVRPPRRAARLGVIVGEQHPLRR